MEQFQHYGERSNLISCRHTKGFERKMRYFGQELILKKASYRTELHLNHVSTWAARKEAQTLVKLSKTGLLTRFSIHSFISPLKWKIVQTLGPKNLQRDQYQSTKKCGTIFLEYERFRGEEEQKPWQNLWNITI